MKNSLPTKKDAAPSATLSDPEWQQVLAQIPLVEPAADLHARNIYTVPIRRGTKAPIDNDWPDQKLDPRRDYLQYFGAGGIAVNLGLSQLQDLEADCMPAEYALEELAPDTQMIYRRGPRKHRLYRVDPLVPAKPIAWTYGDKSILRNENEKNMLVEIRMGRQVSVVPPSLHRSGDMYEWVIYGQPSNVDQNRLERVARLAAAAGAIAFEWVEGSRHVAALAIAGYFKKRGLTQREAEVIFRAVCKAENDKDKIALRQSQTLIRQRPPRRAFRPSKKFSESAWLTFCKNCSATLLRSTLEIKPRVTQKQQAMPTNSILYA